MLAPLGRDLLGMIPFREAEACDYARALTAVDLTRREPHHHPDFQIRVIAGANALYQALAEDMYARLKAAAEAGRPFVGLFPVGPTGQYPRLAQLIADRGLSCAHAQLFFLDEYAYEDGPTIDKRSPWSFEQIARKELLAALPAKDRPQAIHFPGPENIGQYDGMIMEASEGRGADVIYGGIGWSGHFAFWDPHLAEEFGSLEAWRQAPSSFVRLHPMTILHNALRAGGDWSSIPPCAYTIGPSALLSAQYRSFWLDACLGGDLSWQRFIGRLATHGPVTPLVPASILQTAPGEVVFLDAVAADIGGPRTSWQ